MSHEQKYLASKYQSLLKDFGQLLELTIEETKKEYDEPIQGTSAEEIGLQYARCLAAKQALSRFLQKLNSKANERN